MGEQLLKGRVLRCPLTEQIRSTSQCVSHRVVTYVWYRQDAGAESKLKRKLKVGFRTFDLKNGNEIRPLGARSIGWILS